MESVINKSSSRIIQEVAIIKILKVKEHLIKLLSITHSIVVDKLKSLIISNNCSSKLIKE
jgi:hypothetical protein